MCNINQYDLHFINSSQLRFSRYERTLNGDDSEVSTLNSNISSLLFVSKSFPIDWILIVCYLDPITYSVCINVFTSYNFLASKMV